MSFWGMVGWLLIIVTMTLATRWLAARLWPREGMRGLSPASLLADLVWSLILFCSALVAARYIERLADALPGYVLFGVVILVLSLLRAFLYQRTVADNRPVPKLEAAQLVPWAAHNLTYPLFSVGLYLALSLFLRRPVDALLFLPAAVGALLPDLDSRTSPLGHLLPFVSRRLEARVGHCQAWHSLSANLAVALVTAPLSPLIGWAAWALIALGFLSHLLLDLLAPQGILLFWPLSRVRYNAFGGPIGRTGTSVEMKLLGGLAAVIMILSLVVDFSPPTPPPAVPPTFEQSMERYLAMRGKTLVFADVEGTWQATGRRVSARFEILNSAGSSLIMLDHYTGRIFSAGQGAADNLYLNRIQVVQGAAANIKPVEIRLRDQLLAEALPIIYQMQPEPGLQHIFISGDVILPDTPGEGAGLEADLRQTEVPLIVDLGGGHYTFHYLTAAELIGLARVQVSAADLVIVAAYASPPSSPTATPLPALAATEDEP
jgi:membrane-bound metal-dependent hydrolase YbcI (DUF457 family)